MQHPSELTNKVYITVCLCLAGYPERITVVLLTTFSFLSHSKRKMWRVPAAELRTGGLDTSPAYLTDASVSYHVQEKEFLMAKFTLHIADKW